MICHCDSLKNSKAEISQLALHALLSSLQALIALKGPGKAEF